MRATLEETKDITSMLDGLFKSKSYENSNIRLTFGDLEAKAQQMTLRIYSVKFARRLTRLLQSGRDSNKGLP